VTSSVVVFEAATW